MHHTSRLRGGARAPIVLLLVIFAAGYSSAWSAFTREYFCRKSVERVWGFEEMLGCIPYGEYGRLVGDKIRILYPPEELGKDHTSCPIVRGDDSLWVCGNSSLNPTGNLAEIWFNKSRDSKTLCERVVGYCIAAEFYANQFHPLHHTNHVVARYYDKFNDRVDEHLRAYDVNWSESQVVLFEYYEPLTGVTRKARYFQEITINSSSVDAVLGGLYEKGFLIKAYDFPKTTTIPPKPTIVVHELPQEETTTLPARVVKKQGNNLSAFSWIFSATMLLLAFAVYKTYYSYKKKPPKPEEISTNLFHIPGVSHEMIEKLVAAGVESIQTLMWAPSRKVAKKAGLLPGDVKALKKAQKEAFKDYFLVSCPLSMDDLTPKQRESIVKHKCKISKMMGVYRSKEKLTPKQRADLDEIMRPLSEDERAQIQRLINGEVDAEEDLPYRILITSAEIDVGKISLDNL